MKKIAKTAAAAVMVAGAALGIGSAHADPTIDIPSSGKGDHDPYPVWVALRKWDPEVSVTQAQNNAVIWCSLRQGGHPASRAPAPGADRHDLARQTNRLAAA